MIRRLALAILFAASSAHAATFYVANRLCPQHGTIHGEACSHTTTTCGAAGTPCCTLEEAIRRANGAAGTDTIEIHDLTGSTETVGATRADGSAWPNFLTEAACGSTSPTYAQSTEAINIAVASGDSYTLDLGSVTWNGIIFNGGNGSTVSGFTMTNKKPSGCDRTYSGRNPYLWIIADSVVVDGMTLYQPNYDSVLSSNVGIRFGTDDTAAGEGSIIRNSVISGQYHTHIFTSGLATSCADTGLAIYNNSFIPIRTESTGSSATILIIEASGCPAASGSSTANVVFANNKIDYTLCTGDADKRVFYYRETTMPLYIFNNRFRVGSLFRGLVYLQDNVDHSGNSTYQQEHVNFFYNTVTGSGQGFGGDNGSSDWPMCAGSASGAKGVHVLSNLFSGINPAADLGASCATAGNTFNLRSSNDTFNNNMCYASSSPACVRLTGGVDITHTGNTETTTNPNVSNSGTATSTSAPDTLRIQSAASNAVAACSNRPLVHLGQAAGACSVSAAGITFDCTRDIDGDLRPTTGTTADCGADQFTGATPPAGSAAIRRRIVRFGP